MNAPVLTPVAKHSSIYRTHDTEAKLMAFYEANLARWPVPYECLTVPTRYGATHLIASGPLNAPPLVLLHAAGANATMWLPNVADLSRGHRTYALDTVGDLGRSVVTDRHPRTGHEYGEWLGEVFDGLGLGRADVIGSSMGGWIAHGLALCFPERVRRLVLLAPAAGIPSRTRWRSMLLSLVLFPTQSNKRRVIRTLLGESASTNAMWAEYMLIATETRPKLGRPTKFADDELRKTSVPTLLLIGEHEVVYGDIRATIDRAKRLIPRIEAEIIPNAGHVVSADQPEVVNARILKFLTG